MKQLSQERAAPTSANANRFSFELSVFTALLLLSGFCGISYEILYARVLGNLVGDQMAVNASILMTFLLGIGFGTLYAHRFWRFLWLIEASIGACGIGFAFGSEKIDQWLYASLPVLGTGLGSSVLVCTLLLSFPAFLVGCTLPLFVGYLSRLETGRAFAKAYTIYNFGAATTALLIEFWLLRVLGLRLALVSIATLNLFVALVLLLDYGEIRRSPPSPKAAVDFPWTDKIALAVVSVGSAVFQLMMVKTAECLFGPFRETFAFVLAVVLFGIAAGAALTKKFKFGFRMVLAVNLIGISWFLAGLGFASNVYATFYPKAVDSYWFLVLLKLGTLVLVMGLPAVTFGATIPSLLTVQKNAARESGQLLFVSSIGNAFGFLLMAFVLHRSFDYGTITLFIALLTAVGFLIQNRIRLRPVAVVAALLLLAAGTYSNSWEENLLYMGHTTFHSKQDLKKGRARLADPEKFQTFKGYQDVFAINWINNKPYFFINGYQSISLRAPSEKVVGAFSSIFAPETDRALILGVGSGATAGTVGLIFDEVDGVEINPVVVENLFRMKEFNFDIENNPRVRIFQDDAIHYTKVNKKHYSLIINTVTTPLYFSSSKLYTDDFLRRVHKLLVPGGVYVTWVDSRIGDRGLDIVLKTLKESFAHCALGCVKSSYFLLLCSDEPLRARHPDVAQVSPVLNDYFLKGHGLVPSWLAYGLLTVQAYELIEDQQLPVNTLDYPSLEFEMARLTKRGISRFKRRLRRHMKLDEVEVALAPQADWNPYTLLVHTESLLGDSSITKRWQRLIQATDPSTSQFSENKRKAEIDYYTLYAPVSGDADAHHKYGYRLLRERKFLEAIAEFEKALAINPRRNNSYFNLGACYERMGNYEEALKHYRAERRVDPDDDAVLYRVGRVLYAVGRYDDAVAALDQSLTEKERSRAYLVRGQALLALGRLEEALESCQNALDLDSKNKDAMELLRRVDELLEKRNSQDDGRG